MILKSICLTVCICAWLVPTGVNATSVWSVQLTTNAFANPWAMYIVTNEDQLGNIVVVPTGVYFDELSSGQIDPTDLLSLSPIDLLSTPFTDFDMATLPTSDIELTVISVAPDSYDISILQIASLTQPMTNLNPSVQCDASECTSTIYRDPIAGFTANWMVQNSDFATISLVATTAVPIPMPLWLFGSGLLGLIGVARMKVRA